MPNHSPLWAQNQWVYLYHCFKPEQSAGWRLVIRIPVHIHADCSFHVTVPTWKHVISLVWKNISFCFLWLCKNKCQKNSPWEKLSEVIFMKSLLCPPYQQPHKCSIFSIPLTTFKYSANIVYAPTMFQTLWGKWYNSSSDENYLFTHENNLNSIIIRECLRINEEHILYPQARTRFKIPGLKLSSCVTVPWASWTSYL